jgi:hypothetical protein
MEPSLLSEFWSTAGYDGLSLVWGIPSSLLADLTDQDKRRLVDITADLQRRAPAELAWASAWLAGLEPGERVRILLARHPVA